LLKVTTISSRTVYFRPCIQEDGNSAQQAPPEPVIIPSLPEEEVVLPAVLEAAENLLHIPQYDYIGYGSEDAEKPAQTSTQLHEEPLNFFLLLNSSLHSNTILLNFFL